MSNISTRPLANPILILSDAPESTTGLGRVCRDLSTILCTMPEFRIGTLGRGAVGSAKFPWSQFSFPESAQWGEDYIEQVWKNFSHGQPGVIFSNWDASRLHWFAQPHTIVARYASLAKFLGDGRDFAKWGYFPVDSTGIVEDRLPVGAQSAVDGFDRVLAASQWGCDVLKAGGTRNPDWLPHGYFQSAFYTDRLLLNELDTATVTVGCNMSNQARKDWPVAFATAALLKKKYGNKFKFWCHTDRPIGYWNLLALAFEYDVNDCTVITTDLTDRELCNWYNSCQCTILPSSGEGFGYPIVESLACGTACVVTDYAAGPELVEESNRISPVTYRIDTMHNVRRAVITPYGFARRVEAECQLKDVDPVGRAEYLASTVEHLEWDNLGGLWREWFRKGL